VALADKQHRHFPRGSHEVFIATTTGVRAELLKNIAPIIEKSIANGHYPGAVILVGHRGHIIYKGVFGNRRILPDIAPMRFDTVFDIASLTKVVATTPAIMQLVEEGRIDLDASVSKYWPEFAKHGKNAITIRELLTHTSGLPAEIPTNSKKSNVLTQIIQLKLAHPVGKKFFYSDVNFIVLAHLIKIISNESLDQYTQQHIFNPLKMNDTYFSPSSKLRDRIAPTEMIEKKLRWGEVHDPIAHSLGGISGNAGLFSDADNLGIYAQSLLDGGQLHAQFKSTSHFLGPLSISKMTTVQTPEAILEARGLGWDIDSAYSNRGILFPMQSFGHTGWTGTSMWIDPVTQTWIIILTSRAHPTPAKSNHLVLDRRTIATIISASITDVAMYSLKNTGKGELKRAYA
jgi:CubicO group peptidase (beta-lactamase class C family)